MNLTEMLAVRSDYLLRLSANYRNGAHQGHVRFLECPLCGSIVWLSTAPDGEGYSVETMMSPQDCAPCSEVHRRNPELCRWVVKLMNKAIKDALSSLLPTEKDP